MNTRKKKLLYASPFPPMKSGISDYSEVLVSVLRDYCDITLYTDNYKLANEKTRQAFNILTSNDSVDFSDYDYRIYNIGNNPDFHCYIYQAALRNPGLVILHDYVIFFLICGYYQTRDRLFSKIYEIGGIDGLNRIKSQLKRGPNHPLMFKDLAPHLPLNRELLQTDNLIMTHSFFVYNKLVRSAKKAGHIRKINMISQIEEPFVPLDRETLFTRYGIPENSVVICSCGIIAPTKLNHLVCETVRVLNAKCSRKVCYLMAGEGHYVDAYLNETIIKTGFVDLEAFNSVIAHADIIVNLRNPSMGETSAAMLRAMGLGKACIVSDDAWFAELPDSIALKVDNAHAKEELLAHLKRLIAHPEERIALGESARQYIRSEYDPREIAKQIISFMDENA